MALASYFFVGTKEEALANDGLENGDAKKRAKFYRVHHTAIIALFEKLSGVKGPTVDTVAMSEEYDLLTFLFPKKVVEELAKITDETRNSFLVEWKKSEGCPYDNDEDLLDLLQSLGDLSRLALELDEDLYLWNCI